MLCYQNEKFSILYNKYFYGFEKEGKSAYYLANAVRGYYFKYRYPFNDILIQQMVPKIIGHTLTKEYVNQRIRVKTQSEI